MRYPQSIQNLIEHFTKFPTVGPKTAERFVFHLLKQPNSKIQEIVTSLSELKKSTITCKECLAISESSPCEICKDSHRDNNILCVVANTQDKLTIEATKQFNGGYLILGGLINTIQGIKSEDLNIKELLEVIKKNNTKEAILALGSTLEGESTSLYLNKILKEAKIKVTRLARGLPYGSNLEYADEVTLSNALKYRNEI